GGVLKGGCRCGDFISTDGKAQEEVGAIGFGAGGARDPGLRIASGDGGRSNGCAGGIGDDALNARGHLGTDRECPGEQEEESKTEAREATLPAADVQTFPGRKGNANHRIVPPGGRCATGSANAAKSIIQYG